MSSELGTASVEKKPRKKHRIRRFFGRLSLLALVLVLVFVGRSMLWSWQDGRKAEVTTSGPYTAELDSLRKHPLPKWFADAKFGVMIHWGLYSVPGFAPKGMTFNRLLETSYDDAMTRNPYAEDYANAMKDPDSPTARFHREHYGDAPYSDFTRQFEAGLARWNPDQWAEQFKAAGASYVVVTAKYADGYSLWPTQVRNPHAPDFHAKRHLMGELAAAVRKRGLKFGVYYSGGVDWTFQKKVVKTLGDYAFLPYGEDYREYAVAQVRELIQRYKPDLLWNDIGWPTGSKRLYSVIADYYNTVPEGVIDDRWSTASYGRELLGLKPARWGFDQLMKAVFSTGDAAVDSLDDDHLRGRQGRVHHKGRGPVRRRTGFAEGGCGAEGRGAWWEARPAEHRQADHHHDRRQQHHPESSGRWHLCTGRQVRRRGQEIVSVVPIRVRASGGSTA
jgi:alpha-L-fucosidase